MDLTRFIKAHETIYETALNEIKSGHKKTHWMWFIFPQIAGLGQTIRSKHYAISDIEEAKAYMNDPILGNHMIELCETLLGLKTNNPNIVFGYPDDMKLLSSMTLFEVAIPEQALFGAVIDKFYNGIRDEKTIRIIKEGTK